MTLKEIFNILQDNYPEQPFTNANVSSIIFDSLGENTEGVSDAIGESGVLHDVGESHASGEDCKSDLASGELPLKKITEAKESQFGFSIAVIPASWVAKGNPQILCHPDDLPNFDG